MLLDAVSNVLGQSFLGRDICDGIMYCDTTQFSELLHLISKPQAVAAHQQMHPDGHALVKRKGIVHGLRYFLRNIIAAEHPVFHFFFLICEFRNRPSPSIGAAASSPGTGSPSNWTMKCPVSDISPACSVRLFP